MKTIYAILAIAGWVWFIIVMALLAVPTRRGGQRGFDVVEKHEK
jgi:hypothetical protein